MKQLIKNRVFLDEFFNFKKSSYFHLHLEHFDGDLHGSLMTYQLHTHTQQRQSCKKTRMAEGRRRSSSRTTQTMKNAAICSKMAKTRKESASKTQKDTICIVIRNSLSLKKRHRRHTRRHVEYKSRVI